MREEVQVQVRGFTILAREHVTFTTFGVDRIRLAVAFNRHSHPPAAQTATQTERQHPIQIANNERTSSRHNERLQPRPQPPGTKLPLLHRGPQTLLLRQARPPRRSGRRKILPRPPLRQQRLPTQQRTHHRRRLPDPKMPTPQPNNQVRNLGYRGPGKVCEFGADVLSECAECVGGV